MMAALSNTQERALFRQMRPIDEDEFAAWLRVGEPGWVEANAAVLRQAGVTPSEASVIHDEVKPLNLHLSTLLYACHLADLDLRHIHLWLKADLGAPEPKYARMRGQRIITSPSKWINRALKYVAAANGDQEAAAWAALAGLSVDELGTLTRNDELQVDKLRVMAALLDGGPDDDVL